MKAAFPLIISIPKDMSEENFWFLLKTVWFLEKIQQLQILLDGPQVLYLGRQFILVGNKI